MAQARINRQELNESFKFLDALPKFNLETSTSETVSKNDALLLMKKHVIKLYSKGYSPDAIFEILHNPNNNIPVKMQLKDIQECVDNYIELKTKQKLVREENRKRKQAAAEAAAEKNNTPKSD